MIQTSILSTVHSDSDLPLIQYPDKLVLIIEPDDSIRAAYETSLKEAGYHTRAFRSIADAIADFERAHINVVILNLVLPEQDSLQFLSYIRHNFRGTDVILTAAEATVETLTQALRQGAADFLVQPNPQTELLATVERVVAQQTDQSDVHHQPEPLAELEIFRAASELFLKNLSQEEVLSIIGDRALQMSQADYCEIFTPSPDGAGFVSTARLPESKLFPADIISLSEKLAHETIQSQKAIVINQSQDDIAGMKSWLVLPLKVSGSIVGVLCLGDYQNRAFSATIIELLSIFIDQASIAINNAQLFADLTATYSNLAISRTQILQSKNTLQTLFDSITDGLYIVNETLQIVMINQAELDHLGLPLAETTNRKLPDLGWSVAAPTFIEQIKKTFATGQRSHWIPADFDRSPLVHNREMHLYPVASPQRQVQQVIILAQDVTSQKQLQATLFQSANLTALGQLATSIAHEVNNPLTIAITNTQLTMAELDPAEELHEMMEDTYYACNRIKEIVSNLVDFSNQDIYRFSEINLIETIEETLALISHPLRKAGVEIERAYNYTPAITASRSHLKMVWMNLLLNGIDAISEVAESGTITITVDQADNGYVLVKMADTGAGIPDHLQPNIFTPFFTTKPLGQGIGLGLFTARTIVEKHNGIITFQSQGGFTQFTTALPETSPSPPLYQ